MNTYVALEGLDFAGKSELAKALVEILGWKTVNEPYTGNEHAAEVKRMNNANTLPKHYEMMMIIAGRIDCFNEVVVKHRDRGLISDRCVVSSMVYQSSDMFSQSQVLAMNDHALLAAGHNLLPDAIVFIDISHATFLKRLENCNRAIDAKDLFLKDERNWNELRSRYINSLRIVASKGVKVISIDENTPAEKVARLITKK